MPALTISAVDHNNDTLTITAHGLNTGDGPGAMYTPDGTLPAGSSPVTDYWAIRVDANTIKLASSSANAMSGTAVPLTSNGSGTLQFLVGLPYRTPRTAVPGQQVFSADLNAVWLALVALWNFLTGQAQAIFTGIKLATGQHVTLTGTGEYKHGDRNFGQGGEGGATHAGSNYGTSSVSNAPFWQLSASGIVYIPIARHMLAGDRLKSIRIRGDCTQEPTFAIYTQQGATATVRAHTGSNTIVSNGETTLTLNTAYTLVTASGYTDAIYLKVTAPAGDDFEIWHIGGVFDHP